MSKKVKPAYFKNMKLKDLEELISGSLILEGFESELIIQEVKKSQSLETIDDIFNVIFYKELEFIEKGKTELVDTDKLNKRKLSLRKIYFEKNSNAK